MSQHLKGLSSSPTRGRLQQTGHEAMGCSSPLASKPEMAAAALCPKHRPQSYLQCSAEKWMWSVSLEGTKPDGLKPPGFSMPSASVLLPRFTVQSESGSAIKLCKSGWPLRRSWPGVHRRAEEV